MRRSDKMKRIISVFLIFVMSLCFVSVYADETYNCSDWALEEIKKAQELDLIPQSLLSVDLRENITREEFAEVSVKVYENLVKAEVTHEVENPFSDTENAEVVKAYSLGITTGTSDTEFSPNGFLVREEAATMLTRVYKKVTVADWSIDNDTELEFEKGEEFKDHNKISDWAVNSVYFMAANEIIKGVSDNFFAPKNTTDEEKEKGWANTTREQALLMAVRMTGLEVTNIVEYDPDPYKDIVHETPVKEDDENVFTIAFIGGSLTAGGALWISETKKVLEEKMPGKTVVTLNAGKGGTDSSFGAARFSEDVVKYNPDMVVIEFAVNDRGKSEKDSKIYMESMLRQCKKMEKEPTVIFLYAPIPYEKETEEYKEWANGVVWKEQLANHYGIKSINVADYMYRDYEKIKEEKKYERFNDYLKTLYPASGSGFDVHGGYPKYAEAIVEALNEDFEGYMKPMKNVGIFCTADKATVEMRYNQIPVNSPRMNYAGNWDTYTANSKFETTDSKISIGAGHYSYPYFTGGIKQVEKDTAAFGFMTSADAFCVSYTASSAGSSAKVYIDGIESGTISCHSIYSGTNYTSKWIGLPGDGKEHKVILVVDRPTSDNYVYRFGSIIERFYR